MDELNLHFANFNLCFELVGFEKINSDLTYWGSASNLISFISSNNEYEDSNAVNIYIPYRFTNFNNNLRGFKWSNNKMAVNSYEYNTGIFIHEMGHVFNLIHTFQNFNNNNCERVTRDPNDPNYNATSAGDRVVDTNAMPNLNNNTSQINEDCVYIGSGVDCDNTPYVLTDNEIKNFMSYTLQHCRDRFTVGQAIRAREYLNNNSYINFISSGNTDLVVKNSFDDIGLEPDIYTDIIWNSPDIWVRNEPDGYTNQFSEDLHYNGLNSTAYAYVRITNNGCVASATDDLLQLYWAKGGLSQTWPNVWKGLANAGSLDIGNEVGTQSIPVLEPGTSTILEFEWTPGNPQAYENLGFEKPWMFCFLARIESVADPMTFTEVSSAATNARNNNNIAYKNETVINVADRPNKGSIVVGNLGGLNELTSSIEFFTTTSLDYNIWHEAEVRAELSEDLWDLWQNSGAQSTAVRVMNPNRREIMLLDNSASLDYITFAPDEWGIATMSINFLINEVDAQDEFTFHVQQCDSSNQETLGGFTYTFNRDNQRSMFSADYSSSTNNDHTETLYASSINEEAIYNWYDEEGNLVYSGSDFKVNSLVAKKYKLEVIAEEDGHKDYREIETEDKRRINSVSPNPASTTTQVEYIIGPSDNAYIVVTNSVTGVNHNFMINNQTNTVNIPLHYLTVGAYIVNLIIDGNIVDTKHLIKH